MKIELVSTEMKMGALKEAATGLGVTYRVGMTKEDLVEQINEAIVAQDPTVEVIEVDEKKLIGPVETQEVPEADKVEQEVPEADKVEQEVPEADKVEQEGKRKEGTKQA
ncbi:Rho termination factor [Weizmannia phage Youna2]